MGLEFSQLILLALGQHQIIHAGAGFDTLGQQVERGAMILASSELQMPARGG